MANGLLKGTLILTIAGFVVKAIGSINWILLSRILGGEGIGIYQMAFPIYLLLLQVSSAGVPIAISILTAERPSAIIQGLNGSSSYPLSCSPLQASSLAWLCTLVRIG